MPRSLSLPLRSISFALLPLPNSFVGKKMTRYSIFHAALPFLSFPFVVFFEYQTK